MKILVINVGLFFVCGLSNAYATSDEWSQRWKSSSSRSNENLVQANLIELKDSDYYSGLGKTTINSTSTSSIGTVNSATSNVNINGSNNGVDISNDTVNDGAVNSTTTQNNQQCPNLSTQPGASLC
ncbi:MULTISPECIES: hypothetical protein [unclassified Acinetobacter]|uniref:hypothetical protein n=1 Tax=unclassified Acinetobacter TaxID=196816 RepID=UPI0012242CFB|nr:MULTISPECIES: hypothetical protein [unclassified Acinetobacter]RZJ20646.1 MAG: hypothetical protein EON51_14315 [Acinetobacter sp.]